MPTSPIYHVEFIRVSLLFAFLWPVAVPAQPAFGYVHQVTGTNALVIAGPGGALYPVTLAGTAAPSASYSTGAAGSWLYETLMGRPVHLTREDLSRAPNRVDPPAVQIWYADEDIGWRMIKDGLIRYDETTVPSSALGSRYRQAEKEARAARRGIWREEAAMAPAPRTRSIEGHPPPPEAGSGDAIPSMNPSSEWNWRPLGGDEQSATSGKMAQ
ncbi:MAG: thermonuclease family protein [Pseudomonadota bacterium]